jgi:hypothetical protein
MPPPGTESLATPVASGSTAGGVQADVAAGGLVEVLSQPPESPATTNIAFRRKRIEAV